MISSILLPVAMALVLGGLLWRALLAPPLVLVAWRTIVANVTRSSLIIAGLMLATMLITAVLVIEDTLVMAVQTVTVNQVGRVDETITGGQGSLHVFSTSAVAPLRTDLAKHRHVVGIAAALLVSGVLGVDEDARQSHGDLSVLGMDGFGAGPLATLQSEPHGYTLATLTDTAVYLNVDAAQELQVSVGDHLSLYNAAWSGIRYQYLVSAIFTGGPLGRQPTVLMALPQLQRMVGTPQSINRIYLANSGDGTAGVAFSGEIVQAARHILGSAYRVVPVKQRAVDFALAAQETFRRVLVLYALFALAIEVLVILLLFSLVATEQRSSLGTLRAMGLQRSQISELLLFQGAAYALVATLPGVLAGLGLGAILVAFINPESAKFGFPLQVTLDPQHALITCCLGFLITMTTTAGAVWTISRMTIAAAIRGLPEPEYATSQSVGRATLPRWAQTLITLRETLVVWIQRGVVPLLGGIIILAVVRRHPQSLLLMFGIASTISGLGLALYPLVRRLVARDRERIATTQVARQSERIDLVLIGGMLMLFWLLPIDVLAPFGITRFDGSVEVFFLAGLMVLTGAMIALVPNLDTIFLPVKRGIRQLRTVRQVAYLAVAYPVAQRLRSGLSLALFSLVCFTMSVMACIAVSTTQRYGDISSLASGYAILGRPLYTPISAFDSVAETIHQRTSSAESASITAISAATPLPLGVIQLNADNAGWRVYPTSEIEGAFLNGVGLPLVARAPGYVSDAAVWSAMRDVPGNVVIDVGALSSADASAFDLPQPPPISLGNYATPPIASALLGNSTVETLLSRPDTQALLRQTPPELGAVLSDPRQIQAYTLKLQHVRDANNQFTGTTLWLADFRGSGAIPVHVIGLVDNTQGQRYGLLGSPQTFAPLEALQPAVSNAYYYFQLASNTDVALMARTIGTVLLDHGFETTVIQARLRDVNAPRIFASQVLLGLVGLMLIVGTAALMVANLRNVMERRQQVGALRALGMQRLGIVIWFLLESMSIAALGAAIGGLMGVLLCHNAFSQTFFDQLRVSLNLVIPWPTLLTIGVVTIVAAGIAAVIPALQGSRVSPAEALRYE